MHNLLVQLAGVVALAAAITHAVLGETKVFRRVRIEPERLRLLIWLVWQFGTVAWISLAILLIAAPQLGSEAARQPLSQQGHLFVQAPGLVLGVGQVGTQALLGDE